MVARRLREHDLHARTIQLKLRYSDFSTITRAHSFDHGTQLDTEIFQQVRALFRVESESQSDHPAPRRPRIRSQTPGRPAQHARGTDHQSLAQGHVRSGQLRDKFGEDSVSLAMGLKGRFRERVHENPAGLPGKTPGKTPREGG